MEINICCEKCGGELKITQSYADGGDLSLRVAPCDCTVSAQQSVQRTGCTCLFSTSGERLSVNIMCPVCNPQPAN